MELFIDADLSGGARGVAVDEIEAGWKRTKAGYTIECRMPWKMLCVPEAMKADDEIGLEVVINDADENKNRSYCLIWSADRGTCSKDPSRHGRIVLGGKK